MTKKILNHLLFTALLLLCIFITDVHADVDRRTGAFNTETFDFNGLTRHYSSHESASGLFGPGWMTVYDNRVQASADYLFVLNAPAGLYHEFDT